MTPLDSLNFPRSPDEGLNVDHSEYHDSQDEMVGDADVLLSISTHVFYMSSTPKEVPTPNKSRIQKMH